jgi:acetyltransferase-like isoleucine patch superfamily enzyme
VNKDLEAWKLYAGIPAKFIRMRDEIQTKDLERIYKQENNNG